MHPNSAPGGPVVHNASFVLAISSVAALGGLLFGFDTAIISGAIPALRAFFHLSDYALGWAVGSILIGCGLGSALAGALADRFGRRFVLAACALLFGLSGVGAASADAFGILVLSRVIGGVGVGAAAVVSPLYISETAPAAWRGRLVSLYQLAIATGVLSAYLCDYGLAGRGAHAWRLMFASQIIPALVFGLSLLVAPETPRWLVAKRRQSSASEILERTLGEQAGRTELLMIETSLKDTRGVSLRELFSTKYVPVLGLGVLIAVFQQTTGINAILYYAPTIFARTGFDFGSSLLQTVAIGSINLVATLGAMGLVDRVGRKGLLLIGSIVMTVSLSVVAVCLANNYFEGYAVLVFLLLYVAAFACTWGAVTWVYLSEIFPNRIRAMAVSVATVALWLADFVVASAFPMMNAHVGAEATLLCYAASCGVAFLYVLRKVPETKGRGLEELELLFVKGQVL